MDAFQVLGRARQYGMSSPQPLTLQEMEAYFRLNEIDERSVRKRYVRILQDLDEVYLTHAADQAAKAAKNKT